MENDELLADVSLQSSESEEDEEFMQFAVIAFPRNARIFWKRPDHFIEWTDDEFLQRFRLNKHVKFLVEILYNKLS